jgi:hypothetical protein
MPCLIESWLSVPQRPLLVFVQVWSLLLHFMDPAGLLHAAASIVYGHVEEVSDTEGISQRGLLSC